MTRPSILILGGGRQGRVIASELAPDYQVTLADVRTLTGLPESIKTLTADLSDRGRLTQLMKEYGLVVGALPSRLGYQAAQAAVAAGKNYVDIAFFDEDTELLHCLAQENQVAVLLDCGLAPGISNLLVGRGVCAEAEVEEVAIYVGGVAADASRPYGYVVTWSVDDLLEEYKRPARIRRDHETVTLPVFSEREMIDVPGVGQLEAFLTDGVRSLLELEGPKTIIEKTLRWPGHIEAIKPLVESGRFVEEITEKCQEGEDLVVLIVDIAKTRHQMICRAKDGLSAMARSTALTCASFARLVAEGYVDDVGLVPPEQVGRSQQATDFVLKRLAQHGLKIDTFTRDGH